MGRLSKTVSTAGCDLGIPVKHSDDELKAAEAATATAEKEVEWQKRLLSEAEKSKINAVTDISILHGHVAIVGTPEAELLSIKSGTLSPIAWATAELREAHDKISLQSKVSARTAQVQSSMKRMKDNNEFHEGSGKDLKSRRAAAETERGPILHLFDDVRPDVVGLCKRQGAGMLLF